MTTEHDTLPDQIAQHVAAGLTERQQFDGSAALLFRPFAGDETDTTVLTDKIVVAAKDHQHCQICNGTIVKGERHRSMVERNNEDKKIMTFRFCGLCCKAMAHPSTWSTGSKITHRYAIGERRRVRAIEGER